ncbi:MAG TPA: DUF6325 family protein [Micromonosporaceae bacterium]
MPDDLDTMGPVDYLVVEFPGSHLTGEGLPLLVDLVDRGVIKILDLSFLRKEQDGSVAEVSVEEINTAADQDLSAFAGASSGLLGRDDIEEAAAAIEPGSMAGILVYENLWAAPLASAIRRGGGQLVASGRIPVQGILAALDAAEAGR